MSLFSDADVIHSYSREQAIEDGILVAVPEGIAREAGFMIPVALTAGVQSILEAPSRRGEDYTGRLWDVLWLAVLAFRLARRRNPEPYEVVYGASFDGRRHDFVLRFNSFEGFTITLPDED